MSNQLSSLSNLLQQRIEALEKARQSVTELDKNFYLILRKKITRTREINKLHRFFQAS